MNLLSFILGMFLGALLMLGAGAFMYFKGFLFIKKSVFVEQEKAISSLKDEAENLKLRLNMEHELDLFLTEFPHFAQNLRSLTATKLTNRDIFLSALIAEGRHTQFIARTLSISETSVEVARHRLRTKLNLEKGLIWPM